MVGWGLIGQLMCLISGRCWGGSYVRLLTWVPEQAESSLGTHPVPRGCAVLGAFSMRGDATPDVFQASLGTSRNQKPTSCAENAGDSPTLVKTIFFLAQAP